MARDPSPTPWILAAVLTALAFAVGRFTRGDEPPPPPRPRAISPDAPRADPAPSELAGLRGCVEELTALQARVDDECPAFHAAGADGVPDGGVVIGAAEAADVEADEAHRRAHRKAFVERTAGVTGSAAEWLAEYVCITEALRRRSEREVAVAMHDPSALPDVIDEIVADARDDRAGAIGDIRARLGPEHFRRLQRAGGLDTLALMCGHTHEEAPAAVAPDGGVASAR